MAVRLFSRQALLPVRFDLADAHTDRQECLSYQDLAISKLIHFPRKRSGFRKCNDGSLCDCVNAYKLPCEVCGP
jgi:hypothetical protein